VLGDRTPMPARGSGAAPKEPGQPACDGQNRNADNRPGTIASHVPPVLARWPGPDIPIVPLHRGRCHGYRLKDVAFFFVAYLAGVQGHLGHLAAIHLAVVEPIAGPTSHGLDRG